MMKQNTRFNGGGDSCMDLLITMDLQIRDFHL